jgi:hypothetical protein
MKNFRLQAIYQMAFIIRVSSAWAQQIPLLLQLRQFQIIIIMMLLRHFSIPRMEHQLVLQVVNQELNIGRIELIMF